MENAFSHTAGIRKPVRYHLRACFHGGWGPQIGEVTCGGSPHLIEMRDYMDMRVTPPKRVTTPTWDPQPPCKQALNHDEMLCYV